MIGFRATLRRSWPVLVSYGVFSMWGVVCLVMSLVLTSGGFGVSPGDLGVMAGVLLATLVGHIGGNLLGLAGLRLMPVVLLFVVLFIGATLSGVALGPIALFLVIAIFSALGGYLGVASRLDVVAAWYPLSFCVGGAIIWMNRHGAVETFHGGSKHAIWDGFTMACLAGGVFLMLVFLATRNSLGLTVWQEVARPRGLGVDDEAVSVARPGRGSFFVLFVFTLGVLGATALVSPYLFRTADHEGEHDGKSGDGNDDTSNDDKGSSSGKESSSGSGGSSGKESSSGSGGSSGKEASSGNGGSSGKEASSGSGGSSGKGGASSGNGGSSGKGSSSGGSSGKGSSSGQKKRGGSGTSSGGGGSSGESSDDPSDDPLGKPDTDHAGNAASEALGLGMKLFMWLLAAVAALLVFMLVAFPPIRRAFLLRHLERPLWPVAPTARVMNLWRRALSVLAVADIEPAPGETPCDFARRAESELRVTLGCDARGLREAAAIVEKIDYAGRGLGAGEEQAMREAVTAFVQTVNPRLDLKKKVAAAWARAPEVES